MRHVSASLSLASAAAALALITATVVAPESSAGATRVNAVSAGAELAARGAAVKLAPTCTTVPTSVFAKVFMVSVVLSGPFPSKGPVSFFGRTIRVNGKVVIASALGCGYDHDPSNPATIGVALTYLTEPSSPPAISIVKQMCAAMDLNSSYARLKVGSYACVQGHTGAMQSANGLLALDNVVVELFGSQSPNQTVSLLHAVVPYVVKAKATAKKQPVVSVTSSVYAVQNGTIEVDLACGGASCGGNITIGATSSTGPVTIALTHYSVPGSGQMAFHIGLTPEGAAFIAAANGVTLSLTLTVTVVNGATVTQKIALDTGGAPPTSTPTTQPTTTAP